MFGTDLPPEIVIVPDEEVVGLIPKVIGVREHLGMGRSGGEKEGEKEGNSRSPKRAKRKGVSIHGGCGFFSIAQIHRFVNEG
jgi:hypothetical protein